MAENFLTKKIGPLPTIAWVGAGASIVGLVIMMKKNGTNSTTPNTGNVAMLSPTEAEAFGTIEQQQQDVTNALTTLGQNQSALGGSVNTLSGMTAGQITNENTQYGALSQAMADLSTQQTSDTASINGQATQYYSGLQNALSAYVNSLQGSLNGISSAQTTAASQAAAYYNALSAQANQGQITNNDYAAASASYYTSLMNYLNSMQQGLGGSIGTSKAEVLALAQALGKGGAVQNTLNSRGDGTTS